MRLIDRGIKEKRFEGKLKSHLWLQGCCFIEKANSGNLICDRCSIKRVPMFSRQIAKNKKERGFAVQFYSLSTLVVLLGLANVSLMVQAYFVTENAY